MPTVRICLVWFAVVPFCSAQPAPADPPARSEPHLVLDAGGPTSPVTAIAFSPDGETVYSVGLDKLIRSWRVDPRSGRFTRTEATLRVPIGPGLEGSLNALAVSPDGRYVAVGGKSLARGTAGFRVDGRMTPPIGGMTPEMRLDQGSVFVFDLRDNSVRTLRGHTGAVLNLAFVPQSDPPRLVSVAQEWDDSAGKYVGGLRLWELSKPLPRAAIAEPTAPVDRRPGLAVWSTGDGPTEVKVALGWDDGKLRLWDIKSNEILALNDGPLNPGVAVGADGRLFTTAMIREGGRLHEWSTTPTLAEKPGEHQTVFSPDGPRYTYPRALTLCSSTPGQPVDTAAVVLRTPAAGDRYELALVPLSGARAFQSTLRLRLWEGGQLPTIEAIRGGKFLAVAGGPDHAILLYSIADLLAGKAVQPQRLHSQASTFRFVAFVTDGQQTGLVVSPTSAANTAERPVPPNLDRTGRVFDPIGRKLVPFAPPWKIVAPDSAGWSVSTSEPDADRRVAIAIRQPGGTIQSFKLPPAAVPTELALLPPLGKRVNPIIAVAYFDENRQPILALYDGSKGAKFRQLTGHQSRVRRLAFSPDGRLLASIADDQTTSVWSLTDLDTVVGRRGRIDGLGVKAVNGKPEVAQIDSDSPANKLLKVGDRIDGIVQGDKLLSLTGARSFYHAIDAVRPGTTVTLRTMAGNNVVVPVGQGVDERKPLVTLAVFAEADGRFDWIAWNPNGPYETGTLRAERQFGWHLNPANPDGPVIHAGAEQYRGEFRKEGIVQHLLRQGNLADALQDWDGPRVPNPKLGLNFDELGPQAPERNGRILIRRPDLHLRAAVGNPLFPPDRIDAIEWRLDDGPWRPFSDLEDAGRSRTTSLIAAGWVRGPHELEVRLRTTGRRPELFSATIPVEYLPAPPIVSLVPAWKKTVFGDGPVRPIVIKDQAKFRLELDVQPAFVGQHVAVLLRFNDEPLRKLDSRVREDLLLREGLNRIELLAENIGSDKSGHWERSNLVFQVMYSKTAPPPLIAVAPLEGRDTVPQPGQTVLVSAAEFPLAAYITAESPITEVVLNGKPAVGFKSGGRQFLLDQRVPLSAGVQDLTITARSQAGGATTSTFRVDYQPPLPRIIRLEPSAADELITGRDPAEQTLRFRVVPPTDPRPYTLTLTHNGKPLGAPRPIAADAGYLSIPVTLSGGRNRFEIRLQNEWGASSTSREELTFLRPPTVRSINTPKPGALPRFDLSAEIETPIDRPLTRVRLGGRELEAEQFVKLREAGTVAIWAVTVRDLPLDRGANRFTLTPWNADGPALIPRNVEVAFVPPLPPKAEIDLLDPGRDLTVEQDQYTIQFRVRSASPLEAVRLVSDAAPAIAIPVAQAVPLAGGGFELDVQQPLRLLPGANPFRVEAINAGGIARAAVAITFLPPPVEVLFDRLVDDRGAVHSPTAGQDGVPLFPIVPSSRAVLHGRVRWSEGVPGPVGQSRVRVWVNGFQQFPAELDPPARPEARERTFTAAIVLNRAELNRIDVHLPDLPVRDRAHRQFLIRGCTQPLMAQRLHLLVVGLGQEDPAAAKVRALAAVGAAPHPERPGVLEAPGFEEVKVYGPLVGYVNRGTINTQMRMIQHTIRSRRSLVSAGPIDEVVMIYYQGSEHYDESGYFLMTDESKEYRTVRRQREVGVAEDDLAGFFAQTFGAQVLLLDVARTVPVPARPSGLLGESRGLGLMRTAWTGSPTAVTGDDRLLAILSRVGPTAETIRELADRLGETVDRLASRYPPETLRYEAFVPVSLEWLPLTHR